MNGERMSRAVVCAAAPALGAAPALAVEPDSLRRDPSGDVDCNDDLNARAFDNDPIAFVTQVI